MSLFSIMITFSVVIRLDCWVGFSVVRSQSKPNHPKFIKAKQSGVKNTSLLTIFVEFLQFIKTKTTRHTPVQMKYRHFGRQEEAEVKYNEDSYVWTER